MKLGATVAAFAAFAAIVLASRAEAGCVIAPDGESIDVITDNGTSDEKTCSVACQVDTKIGVVQVSCGGTTPPLAKQHSLCNFDKPEPWYKRVVSSVDSCKGDTAAVPPAPPPAAAVKPGTAICRISPDGHSFDAVIANPYSADATCQVDCKISTTVAGTTAQSSCTNNVTAGAGEAVLCTHTFNAGRLVKVIGDSGQCYDPTPKAPAADNNDDTTDSDKLTTVPMPKPSRAKKDDVDMQELANDPARSTTWTNPDFFWSGRMATRWTVLLICLSIPALLAAATVWIQIQNNRIRSWKEAAGRIVSSKATAREVRSHQVESSGGGRDTDIVTDEIIETRNFAEISYSFVVGSSTYHGKRISLSPDLGNVEVAETLQRYPEGKAVTVVYDPLNPNECLLERDDPSKIRKAWLAVGVLVALIAIGFVAITMGADRLATLVAKPAMTPLVVALGIFALVIMLFARVAGKQARDMKAWSKTAGHITRSEIETAVQHHTRTGLGRDYDVTMYVPRVVYSYQVGGNSFDGDNVGWSGSASAPAFAQKYLKRFTLQMPVEVFYDPLAPTQSTLVRPGGMWAVVLWMIAFGFIGAAIAVGWLWPQ